MQLPTPPKPPEMSAEVLAWFHAHPEAAEDRPGLIEGLTPEVTAYLAARQDWRAAEDLYYAALPFDADYVTGPHGRFRIWGGEWLDARVLPPYGLTVTAVWDDCSYAISLPDALTRAFTRMEAPEFREYVDKLYRLLREREAAHVAFVRALHEGGGA